LRPASFFFKPALEPLTQAKMPSLTDCRKTTVNGVYKFLPTLLAQIMLVAIEFGRNID